MVITADDGEESSFARLSAAEETAIVVAKISKHTSQGAWLDENGDAALAASRKSPWPRLCPWRRHRQTETRPDTLLVNRSKKTLDKASAFCGNWHPDSRGFHGEHRRKADGWQLEILCRVQMPRDELHVCLKLSDRPEVVPLQKASRSADIAEDVTLYWPVRWWVPCPSRYCFGS